MSKELQQSNQSNQNESVNFNYCAPHLIPKVQSKIQPKVYSRIQPKLMTGIGQNHNYGQSSFPSKLPEEVQAKMENSFGQDFSEVVIHKNSLSACNPPENLDSLKLVKFSNLKLSYEKKQIHRNPNCQSS